MNKKEIILVLLVALVLAGLGIHNTLNNNTHHDHTKDAWRSTNVDSGISVVKPNTEDND